MKNIQIKCLHDKEKVKPKRCSGNVSMLFFAKPDPIRLRPGQSILLPTGVNVFIPDKEIIGVITSTPFNSDNGLMVHGGTQLIPFGFEKEIKVKIKNEHPTRIQTIDGYSPLCLLYFTSIIIPRYVEVQDFKAGKDKDD